METFADNKSNVTNMMNIVHYRVKISLLFLKAVSFIIIIISIAYFFFSSISYWVKYDIALLNSSQNTILEEVTCNSKLPPFNS